MNILIDLYYTIVMYNIIIDIYIYMYRSSHMPPGVYTHYTCMHQQHAHMQVVGRKETNKTTDS